MRRCVRRLERIPLSLHLLLFRLAVAAVFLPPGLAKIASWESTVALFQDEYRVPLLPPAAAAALTATFEVGCSTLLIAGLATRVATLPLLAMAVTIQLFVYPQAWPEHLVWAAMLSLLLTRGGGAISLDHVIARVLEGKARANARTRDLV